MNLKHILAGFAGAQLQRLEQTEQEKKYHINVGSIKIKKRLKLHLTDDQEENERTLNRLRELIGEANWLDSLFKAIKESFGDPMELARSGLRPMGKRYWNPTHHTLNVFALGITDTDGVLITHVKPGESVIVPVGYTIGMKSSAVHGIAPQLRPMHEPTRELELDITPTSYLEWCTFGDSRLYSKCCKKYLAWSDSLNRLCCQKCGARVG